MNSGGSPSNRRGFSMIEIIVALVVGILVLTGVVKLMITQGRGYGKQRELVDIRETARQAAGLLSWDLRQAATGGSSFIAMAANSVTLRSPRGVGTVCAKSTLLPRVALWKTAGNIQATVDDTALVYQMGKGQWSKLKISAVGTPLAMGITACAWPGARAPDLVVEFALPTKADSTAYFKLTQVGAPFRSFRKVQYAEYQLNNRWWLGRKVGAAASYEQLTGPLQAPTAGLSFSYFDTLGAVTVNPAAVGSVAFTLRTESYKNTNVGTSFAYQRDSLTTKVALRRW